MAEHQEVKSPRDNSRESRAAQTYAYVNNVVRNEFNNVSNAQIQKRSEHSSNSDNCSNASYGR